MNIKVKNFYLWFVLNAKQREDWPNFAPKRSNFGNALFIVDKYMLDKTIIKNSRYKSFLIFNRIINE